MSFNERGMLLLLNLVSLLPLAGAGLVISAGLIAYHGVAGAPLVIDALPASLPTGVGLAAVILVLPLHEWIHGLAIRRYGHTPRYGVKWAVMFATSDGALFRRDEFVRIALAPLVVVSGGGLLLLLFLPLGLATWIGLAVAVNAAGAIGDLWMTAVALRHDRTALILDEEDGMRIFARAA